jgi:hypothetical protein
MEILGGECCRVLARARVCNIPSFGTRHLLSLARCSLYAKAQILAYNECENYSIHPNHPSSSISSHSTLARSLAHGRHILLSIIIKLPMSTTMGDINGKSTARGRAAVRCWEPPASAPQIISCVSPPRLSRRLLILRRIGIRFPSCAIICDATPARIYSGAEQEKPIKAGTLQPPAVTQAPNQ